MEIRRNRLIGFILWVMVLFLGLSSRKFGYLMPETVNLYLGDALWALMIYTMIGLIFKKWTILKVALAGISFCYLIEISQFYHAEWIDAIRNTTLGGLVLGFGFLWSDMVAYTFGIGFGVVVEWTLTTWQKRKNNL